MLKVSVAYELAAAPSADDRTCLPFCTSCTHEWLFPLLLFLRSRVCHTRTKWHTGAHSQVEQEQSCSGAMLHFQVRLTPTRQPLTSTCLPHCSHELLPQWTHQKTFGGVVLHSGHKLNSLKLFLSIVHWSLFSSTHFPLTFHFLHVAVVTRRVQWMPAFLSPH